MTRTAPKTSTAVTAPGSLPSLARAAAKLIEDAAAAGLLTPTGVSVHDYGPPAVSLHLFGREISVLHCLRQWASRYHGDLATRQAHTDPASIYAAVSFRHQGVSYEVATIIHTSDPGYDDAAARTGDDQQEDES